MAKFNFCLLFIGLLTVVYCLPVDKNVKKKEEESSENEIHHQRENDLVSNLPGAGEIQLKAIH